MLRFNRDSLCSYNPLFGFFGERLHLIKVEHFSRHSARETVIYKRAVFIKNENQLLVLKSQLDEQTAPLYARHVLQQS